MVSVAALSRLTGSYEWAETMLREALTHNPHDAGARLNLVADRLQEEKPAEALSLLNEVDPPADDIAAARHWHLQRALALIALGRPDEARTALGEFEALGRAPPRTQAAAACGATRCWRFPKAAAPRRALMPTRWRPRSRPWGRAPYSSTRSWRATTSPNSNGRATS
jgi:hypothetical protein